MSGTKGYVAVGNEANGNARGFFGIVPHSIVKNKIYKLA